MTQCVEAGVKTQYYNFWMGHKQFDTGQNDNAYFRSEIAKHLEEYKKAISRLCIEEYEAVGIKGEVKDLLSTIHEQQKRIDSLENHLLRAGMHEEKYNKEIEDLKRQLERVDRVEMQIAQLVTQQKAWVFVPRQHAEEAFTDIMGSKDKAREVLAKLEKIRKKQQKS